MAETEQYTTFPYQKRATNAKSKNFCKQCLESALHLTQKGGNISDKTTMFINTDLYKGKLHKGDISKEVNPYGVDGDFFPEEIGSYPLLRSKIDLLVGEEWKRRFDWNVVVVNPNAVTEKSKGQKDKLFEFITQKLMSDETLDEKQIEEEIKKLDKWRRYSYKDLRELRASQFLNYLFRKLELKSKFNEGFKNKLLTKVEAYCVDIVANEPIVRVVDPKNIYVVRNAGSNYLEDADIIVEDSYQSPGWIIDNYYDYLTSTQVANIDKGLPESSTGEGDLLNYTDGSHGYTWPTTNLDYTIDVDAMTTPGGKGVKDDDGNIRVVRCVWKSLRKLGIITWYDEEGMKQERIVDENYSAKPQQGEKIKWVFVNEWWETTRIGKDIYTKNRPRPIQFRRKGNISAAGSGYIGYISDVSLVDVMKPYQYMYDIFMHRTKLAFSKSYGKILNVDMSKIPDGWGMDKYLHYLKTMNISFEDPFNEGKKGVATGKLAGNMQQNNRVTDMEMGNYIAQHVQMLNYIELRIGDIVGISKQREGQISSSETVGGVERSVTQSSHVTEPVFAEHEQVKERVLETLLETAKYVWRDRKEPVQYISNDLTKVLTEIDGAMFNEIEFGISISSTSDDNALAEAYKELAHAAIQNDKMSLTTLGTIYASPSMADVRRRIETEEEEALQRVQQNEEANREVQQQIAQQNAAVEQEKMQLEQYKVDKDSETKLAIAMLSKTDMGAEGNSEEALRKLELEWKKQEQSFMTKQKELELKNKEFKEKERHNKATETISKQKKSNT